MSRPEDLLPPDMFYNTTESRKYTTSSRIRSIQASMTHRALSLLDLTGPSLILDIGSGSGLSGEILSAPPSPSSPAGPHTWVGMDVSAAMLGEALARDVEGDMLLADAGQGVPFRAGTFDAAISISAIQWLCNADGSSAAADGAEGRLRRFFDGLYAALRRGARAVCQFYPRDAAQRAMISSAAVRAGFGAGILEDDPDTKNVKVYLVLSVGEGDVTGAVSGMEGVDVVDSRRKDGRRRAAAAGTEKKKKKQKGGRAWILHKKRQMEDQGRVVKRNSKYTGRKRRTAF